MKNFGFKRFPLNVNNSRILQAGLVLNNKDTLYDNFQYFDPLSDTETF